MTNTPPNSLLQTYNIPFWGEDYFSINDSGEVMIHPSGKNQSQEISFASIIKNIQKAGLSLPILVRFPDILHHRVNSLCSAFNRVAKELHYKGGYTAVYPVKVNQQRRVVEEIVKTQPAQKNRQIGLEAGSKPELIAVLAQCPPQATIVCNGYKDREFVRLALIGQAMGHTVYIVVEKPSELPIILEESQKMKVTPYIGLRARLSSIGKGNWQNTGGEKSKFGLSATQILEAINLLQTQNQLQYLKLLHFHLGSQIANIRDIQTGLRECARFYSELLSLGADIDVVDVGGGLGVDYEGTRTRNLCSINYNMHEYAFHVLRTLKEECDRVGVPHPNIITESGRAMTAHHAVLITNIIDQERAIPSENTSPSADKDLPPVLADLVQDLSALEDETNPRSMVEIYHDAAHALQEAQSLFVHGVFNLEQRSHAERLYQSLCLSLRGKLNQSNRTHREILDELNEKLADKVFVNFSLFQSMPDVWGINQIFPILPLSGLDKPCLRRVVIQDMTCDSDGRIDDYVDNDGIEKTLPLPENCKELGFFMVGAYQEILGDMHNLFGDTNSVDIYINENNEVSLEHIIQGDTVDAVLKYVNFESEPLLEALKQKISGAELTTTQADGFYQELEAGLSGYTYFEE